MRSKLLILALSSAAAACTTAPAQQADRGVASVNVPVVCGDQLVSPGDVVIADDDGIVCVRRERAAEVLAAAQARVANEADKRARLASGELGVDMYNLRPLLEELGVRYE